MKGVVKCLIAGGIIVAIGVVILLITLGVNGWHIKDAEFSMQTYAAEQDNSSLEISIGAGSVVTEFYDGEKITVEYPSSDSFKTSIEETDGTLKFHSKPKWSRLFFGIKDIPQTVIKIPQNSVMNVKLEMSAGSASLADGSYGNFDLDISAGTFKANYINCETFDCDMSAGTVSINETVCKKADCDLSAGSMNIGKLTATETSIDISAGSVKLTLTGDKSEYSITTDVSAGSCNVSYQTGTTEKRIDVDVSAGSVNIGFGA